MSPDHIVSVESYSQDYCNKAFTPCETVDENCNRQELKLNCHDLEANSNKLDLVLKDSVSESENVSSDRKSSNMVSISIVPQKDHLLVFSLTGELENNSNALINLGKDPNSDKENGCFFANRTRHIVLLIGTLCMMMILSNILILNVTIVCMTSNSTSKESLESENWTAHHSESQLEFSYSTMEKSSLFAFMAGGALLAVPSAVYLVKRLGARKAFVLAGMLSAISTAFNPMAAELGVHFFIVARIGQGIPLAFCLPVVGSLTSGWSTVKSHGVFVAIASGFVQLAPVFTMPMAGIFCTSSLGWPMVFYVHAAFTVLLFTLWAAFYKDSPLSHPCVSKKEIVIITTGKPETLPNQKVPILKIFTSPAVWAIWFAAFANFAGMQLFVIFMPTYMNRVLGLSLKTASILAAFPPLSQFLVKLFAVAAADYFNFFSKISQTSKLRIFNTISSLGGGILLLVLALIPTTDLLLSFMLLILASSVLGFNTSGVFKSTSMVAKQHTYFVTGVIQFIYCFVLLTMPFAIEAMSAKRPSKDWSIVFLMLAFLLSFSNIFFCVFGKGTAAPWTKISNKQLN